MLTQYYRFCTMVTC